MDKRASEAKSHELESRRRLQRRAVGKSSDAFAYREARQVKRRACPHSPRNGFQPFGRGDRRVRRRLHRKTTGDRGMARTSLNTIESRLLTRIRLA